MSGRVTAGHVYRAINAITAALSTEGIPKSRTNSQEQYDYRSIDDVLGRLSPLLAKHRLCVLPRLLRRECVDRAGEGDSVMISVHVLVAYDLVSARDGSRHTLRTSGEAVDESDKATAKALSAAYKSAMLQTFCVPVTGSDDADAKSPKQRKHVIGNEPLQGWQAWSMDIVEMIGCCETAEALDRMRSRQAALLTAISRERADLYARIGEAFGGRLQDLAHPSSSSPTSERQLAVEDEPGSRGQTVDA